MINFKNYRKTSIKLMGYSLRTKRYRYTIWVGDWFYAGLPLDEYKIAGKELYDLEKDPMETANFANNPEYSDIHKKLDIDMKQYLSGQYKHLQDYFASLDLKPEWIKPTLKQAIKK